MIIYFVIDENFSINDYLIEKIMTSIYIVEYLLFSILTDNPLNILSYFLQIHNQSLFFFFSITSHMNENI